LIGNAPPVVIDGESFNLQGSRLGDFTAQATLSNGSQFELVKQFDDHNNRIGYEYMGGGRTPTRKSELTGTGEVGSRAIAPVIFLNFCRGLIDHACHISVVYMDFPDTTSWRRGSSAAKTGKPRARELQAQCRDI
jgi:hypothetical protein